jgi:hypothetical protein
MKTMITILALAWALIANAGADLTGTQIQEIIAWNDSFGFIYIGSRDIDQLQNGHPILQKVMYQFEVVQ